jgi:two-component sensor histidine kinase
VSSARGGEFWLRGLWQSISRFDPLGKPALVVLLILPLLSVLIYDGGLYGYDNPRYWISAAISYPTFVLSYLLLLTPFSKLPKLSGSVLGKTIAMLAAFLSRTVLSTALAAEAPTQFVEILLQRLPGDTSIILIVWAATATATASNNEYRLALGEALKSAKELEEQRELSDRAADSANQKLKSLALSSLEDELEKIGHGLKSASDQRDLWRLAVEIKQLIESKVRPLTKSLLNSSGLLADLHRDQQLLGKRPSLAELTVSPRADARFGLAYLVASTNIFVTIAQLSDLPTAINVQIVSLSFPLIAFVLGRFRKRAARSSIATAFGWFSFVAVLSYLPTLWAINRFSKEFEDLVPIQLTAFIVLAILVLAFTSWASFQRSRTERLEQMLEIQAELKRELAIVDRHIWLAKRKWSYLVHGTVQGALSVASSRLTFSDSPSKELTKQVIKDVERAKRALQETVEFRKSASELALEIKKSWEGICAVSFALSAEVWSLLDRDESARNCFFEIAKEIVSNAYRHGKAQNVWISCYLSQDNDLRVIASNNGAELPKDFVPGLGFSMFDELTASWAIEPGTDNRMTASIPVQRDSNSSDN